MAEERLDLRREVFNKAQYIKTIDTSFDELGATTITEDLQLQPTVEEFFGLYNSLFYDIQALGETNSHQYLVQTSGEYINFDEVNEEISALQAEIAQLRQDLLNLQMENIKSVASMANNEATNQMLNDATQALNDANAQIVETNSTNSTITETSNNGGGSY